MKQYVTVGLGVLVGAALFETALIPGLLIGGVAVLAPRYLPKGTLPKLRRRVETLAEKALHRQPADAGTAAASQQSMVGGIQNVLPKFAIGQALAKTVTFRIIVTGLDFTTNYLVIGEVATAAGLSTFNLIAGPLFYFTHEAVWNHLGPAETGDGVRVQLPTSNPDDKAWLTISPALAKTITYRTIATVVDFTTNYVVVGSVAEATILSATGFFLGPFVYYGHEKAWEYFGGEPAEKNAPTKPVALLHAT